jgi:hydrogenase expression/formation protein HypE
MRKASEEAGAWIVTGDTKVVPRGKADGVFINTAGVGALLTDRTIAADQTKPGDSILITGPVGNHGMAVLSARGDFGIKGDLFSDVAPLNGLVSELLASGMAVHAMRDATRGGAATVLNEISEASAVEIVIDESSVPVTEPVESACAILGFEPLYAANEGVLIVALPHTQAEEALAVLRKHPYGKMAARIGAVRETDEPRVLLKTKIGSHRILDIRSGDQLPRIC